MGQDCPTQDPIENGKMGRFSPDFFLALQCWDTPAPYFRYGMQIAALGLVITDIGLEALGLD